MNSVSVHLRAQRAVLVAWSFSVFLYGLLIGVAYITVGDGEEYDKIWDQMPEGLKEAFGGVTSITSVDGYLASQMTSLIPVVIGIFVVAQMTGTLAGAEERGRLDHWLSRPVSRTSYYWGTLASTGLVTMLVLVAGALGALVGLAAAGVSATDLLGAVAMNLELLPILAVLVALGAATGTLFHRKGPAMGTGVGVLAAWYLMNILGNLVDELEWLTYLTPFGYVGRSDWFHGHLDWGYLVVCALAAAALMFWGAWAFDRKDLHA